METHVMHHEDGVWVHLEEVLSVGLDEPAEAVCVVGAKNALAGYNTVNAYRHQHVDAARARHAHNLAMMLGSSQ